MRISDWSSDVCSSDLHEMRGQPLGIGEQHAADRIERIVDPNAQIFARRFAVRRSLPGIANVAPAQHDPERWCSVANAVVLWQEADRSLDNECADLDFPSTPEHFG